MEFQTELGTGLSTYFQLVCVPWWSEDTKQLFSDRKSMAGGKVFSDQVYCGLKKFKDDGKSEKHKGASMASWGNHCLRVCAQRRKMTVIMLS